MIFLLNRISRRNLFLDNSWQYGLNVTAEKRDALSRGDTSGLIVHPLLLNAGELLGYQLFNEWYAQGVPTGCEARKAMLIFDALEREDCLLDSATLMQIYNLMGIYYAARGERSMFVELFKKLGKVAANSPALGLDDTLVLDPASYVEPASSCPQGPVQEARSAFCAMIFTELAVTLADRIPPILDISLLARFRNLAVSLDGLLARCKY